MINPINLHTISNNTAYNKQNLRQKGISFKGALGEELIKKAVMEGKELPTAEVILDNITALRGLSVSKTRDVLETLLSIIKSHNAEKSELKKNNNKLKREIQFLENDGDKLAAENQSLRDKIVKLEKNKSI